MTATDERARVGATLYREVRDFAPEDWTSGMLVVALMIADDANERTRISIIERPLLCARVRMKESGLREALTKLSRAGYEFRRPIGRGPGGNIVFSARGRDVEYQVPLIAEYGAHLAYDADAAAPVDKPP